MGLTTIGGEIQAQPLNDNFSYLLAPDSARINTTSNSYGGATSQFHIKNDSGNVTLTLQHAETIADVTPLDTMRIFRVIDSLGGTANQNGALIVRSTIQADCNHNEFGILSIIDNSTTSSTPQQVGIYSQITSSGAGAATIWGGVLEAKNTIIGAGDTLTGGTSVNHILTGCEIDVVNKFSFSDTIKKIGIECIAYGSGECTEAFSVYAAANTRGDGIHYTTGHWRYGFRILTNALHATSGIGLEIATTCDKGMHVGALAMNTAGVHLENTSGYGLLIEGTPSYPIVIPSNKKILLNNKADTNTGIVYDTSATAIILDSKKIAVNNHSASTTATSGSATLPVAPQGFLACFVNGAEQRIPYYNV